LKTFFKVNKKKKTFLQFLYNLWSWRNKEYYDDNFVRPAIPVQVISQQLRDYVAAISNDKVVEGRPRTVVLIGWSPPRTSFVKLNTDGASKDNQIAGCGGVIRGCQGDWLGGFAKCVGKCSAFVAEA
jgi:hypothetical protein